MHSALADGEWETRAVTTGEVVDRLRARALLREMAEAAHVCGDPGIQYDSTINRWNPVKASGRIHSSNPCSEYMFLDDTACNLASLNLMRFVDDAGRFDVEAFRRAVALTILAQEILVDHAAYPTPRIERNSHLYRPLGLGYANLGALLMASGLPYDSDEGRDLAAALTALLCGQAYLTSAEIAEAMGPFPRFRMNRRPFLEVIGMHAAAADAIPSAGVPADLLSAARECWAAALAAGRRHGVKNAQVTVLAPTGTIAFMMDCDTTGVEPDIALVKYKKLVGGGLLKIVNNTVPMALRRLGYDEPQIRAIVAHVDARETIEGAPGLREEHLPVFDCAFRAANGTRSIEWMGHLRMMGAVQPFLSGAISKTVNLPADATVADIEAAYVEGWRLGLKALAVYRDGSKRTQPLNAGRERDEAPGLAPARPVRRKLDDERQAVTHKFSISGHEGYLTIGLYEDGQPGEIFLRMAKEGSTVSGLMDTIATMTSIALQYGVPLKALVDKFSHTRFEPAGFTNNRSIPIAKSVMDYVFRYLGNRFLRGEPEVADEQEAVGAGGGATPSGLRAVVAGGSGGAPLAAAYGIVNQADAPSCPDCGAIMIRNGACYKCANCGGTSGCS
jgi:ribonucleoside-diphosphate reductase alpha chain